jgi:small subunit ribosomal protein S18
MARERNPKKGKGRGKGKGKGKGKYNQNADAMGRPRFKKRRKGCMFCIEKRSSLNYQDLDLVRRFITERGKIAPRRFTGCCAKHQRVVSRAILRARQMGLVPYSMD